MSAERNLYEICPFYKYTPDNKHGGKLVSTWDKFKTSKPYDGSLTSPVQIYDYSWYDPQSKYNDVAEKEIDDEAKSIGLEVAPRSKRKDVLSLVCKKWNSFSLAMETYIFTIIVDKSDEPEIKAFINKHAFKMALK